MIHPVSIAAGLFICALAFLVAKKTAEESQSSCKKLIFGALTTSAFIAWVFGGSAGTEPVDAGIIDDPIRGSSERVVVRDVSDEDRLVDQLRLFALQSVAAVAGIVAGRKARRKR